MPPVIVMSSLHHHNNAIYASCRFVLRLVELFEDPTWSVYTITLIWSCCIVVVVVIIYFPVFPVTSTFHPMLQKKKKITEKNSYKNI